MRATRAWTRLDPWIDLGVLAAKRRATSTTYRVKTMDATLYGQPVRAFVYHSSAWDKKKEHTLQRTIAREAQTLEKWAKKLAKDLSLYRGREGGECTAPQDRKN